MKWADVGRASDLIARRQQLYGILSRIDHTPGIDMLCHFQRCGYTESPNVITLSAPIVRPLVAAELADVERMLRDLGVEI